MTSKRQTDTLETQTDTRHPEAPPPETVEVATTRSIELTQVATRREHDLLGEVNVPAKAYWGVHTLRAVENFPITGVPVGHFPEFVKALALVKQAAARANRRLGHLPAEKADVIAAVCDVAPGMVVVDEAYAEFAAGPSATTLLSAYPRLIVSRTMSKAFALAGARVGYLAASPAVVDALRLVRLPYHLSAITQVVARIALARMTELLATVELVKKQRDRLVSEITALGLTVPPTDANFMLFGPFDEPPRVWQALLDRGVLVRDVSSGPGLAGWLRVNAGTKSETTAFLSALEEVISL